jgi:NAD(P)-dependent dehydrogenase (short-subunit alcohol dehydrogenase family)
MGASGTVSPWEMAQGRRASNTRTDFDAGGRNGYEGRMERTAIVTGAARGIGRGVADHLDAQGWRVARLDVEAGRGIVPCDVSDEGSVAQAFEMLGDFFRDGLGLLVNNAGIADPHGGPLEEMPLESGTAISP